MLAAAKIDRKDRLVGILLGIDAAVPVAEVYPLEPWLFFARIMVPAGRDGAWTYNVV